RGAVPLSLQVFAAAQHQGGHALPSHAGHHRRSRRSGRAGAFLQVHGDAAGGTGGATAGVDRDRDQGGSWGNTGGATAGVDRDRDQGGSWGWEAHEQSDRGASRSDRLSRAQSWNDDSLVTTNR